MSCCEAWDARYGCHHEICPGCYCDKGHDQNVCDACHVYNMEHAEAPAYIAKFGPKNTRAERASQDSESGVGG